eukprot:CAMPEP_0201617756 /NCGR_PEP_ID=MMETSP0492-20130828/37152_1 /ASSEMBLY_ACC=CAM_ASM_000837 /TAXON_ID=420259 /ORGANISM="Thalassiosira gravida, Strain GMp14c1" /LENGTH=383 /DNA_ID=CAMNT_0048086109 /DNA_START=29 /DNA_END=1177 /DNA_ORIENTATION=-
MTAVTAMESNGLQVIVPPGTLEHTHGNDNTTNVEKNVAAAKPEAEENGHLKTEILNRLDRARILANDDKLLLAANLLHGIDEKHLQTIHHDILKEAAIFNIILEDSTTSLDGNNDGGGWMKQGDHTGRHSFSMYYKLKDNQLYCRLETVVHSNLLVPILSVLNESELYQTWLPNYNVPRIKVVKSEKLHQSGRCGQVVNVETEVPWPLAKRQVILKAVACDNIDSYPEEEDSVKSNECLGKDGGKILIRISSMDCQDNLEEGLNIPPVEKGVARMKVKGGFTLRKCPSNNPLLETTMRYDVTAASRDPSSAAAAAEDLVLFTFSFCVDPQLAVIPKVFVNFFLRTAMGQMWNMFLNVAEDIKDGKRPDHSKAIEEKREVLYDW